VSGYISFDLDVSISLQLRSVSAARMNQYPPVHQLAVLSTGWAAFFHSAPDGVHHSPFFFSTDHCICIFLYFFLVLGRFSPGPDLRDNCPAHFPTLISIVPTKVPYLLFPISIVILITSYHIDLAIVLTTYPTNLATLLITYPTNLTIVLTTYPTNLITLHTQSPY
jgi:hypothetical protein